MTQKLQSFRPRGSQPDDDRRITRWFEVGAEPQFLVAEGVEWELIPARQRDQTRSVPVIREWIRSVQLPKHWPYAKHHDSTGACIFENETEAIEACKRARDHGEHVAWDR